MTSQSTDTSSREQHIPCQETSIDSKDDLRVRYQLPGFSAESERCVITSLLIRWFDFANLVRDLWRRVHRIAAMVTSATAAKTFMQIESAWANSGSVPQRTYGRADLLVIHEALP